MLRITLQFIADSIIKRMEAISDRTDDLSNKEFGYLYNMGQELVTFSMMVFAMELD